MKSNDARRTRFDGATALITGAGSGIGRELATSFAREGAAVVVVDRDGDAAATVAAALNADGHRAHPISADVAEADQVAKMAAEAGEQVGPVDVLVNNAAIPGPDGFEATDLDGWEETLGVVLTGAFLCARTILPGMVERRTGAIVNIASVNAFVHLGNEPYSAAKAGLVSLTQSVAVRYGPHGIRCNAVAPGTIRTDGWNPRLERDPEIFERLGARYPLGRVGEAADVAAAVLFLASAEAAWITGTVLRVDGGLLAGDESLRRTLLAED